MWAAAPGSAFKVLDTRLKASRSDMDIGWDSFWLVAHMSLLHIPLEYVIVQERLLEMSLSVGLIPARRIGTSNLRV